MKGGFVITSKEKKNKVNVTACGGLNYVGVLGRRAVIEVCEGSREDETELTSLGGFGKAFMYNDTTVLKHGVKPLKKYPVVAVDGCTLNCATETLKFMGVEPAASVQVISIIKGETSRRVSNITQEEIDMVREKIEEAVDRLLEETPSD
ncbi:MAG: putative zinc-binding protein [Candidatus Syntropharchaeales archaeon]